MNSSNLIIGIAIGTPVLAPALRPNASLLAAADLTAVGTSTGARAAALSSSAIVTASAEVIHAGAGASLLASAGVTADPSVDLIGGPVDHGAASLSSSATVTAAGSFVVLGAASLSSSATVTAVPDVIWGGTATLTGTAGVTGSAVQTHAEDASLTGRAIVTGSPAFLFLTNSGLILEDDFDRGDSTNLGSGYVEHVGNFTIESNLLHVHSNSASRNRLAERDDVNAGEMFVICHINCPSLVGSTELQEIILRFDGTSIATAVGYGFRLGDNGTLRIVTYNADSGSTLANSAGNPGRNTTVSAYVADGVQEGHANGQTVSASDTTHDAAGSRDVGFLGDTTSGLTGNHLWNDLRAYETKNIVVSGMPSGWKAKVLNAGESVVATATESGGVATISLHPFNGATEECPIGGFPTIIVTDGSDVEKGRNDSDPVYPGNTYDA